MQKVDLIDEILSSVPFECMDKWWKKLEVDTLLQEETKKCSSEQWKRLLEIHDLKPYDVAKEALSIANEFSTTQPNEESAPSIDSIKAEIYDIGKGRPPSFKHVLALKRVISQKSKIYRTASSMRFALKVKKVFAFSNIMDNFFPARDRCLICSTGSAKQYLCQLNASMLSEVHKLFTTNEWMGFSDSVEENKDFLCEYLLNISESNLIFIHDNFEILSESYDKIIFIADRLCFCDENILQNMFKKLNHKRFYGDSRKRFSGLVALKFPECSEKCDRSKLVTELCKELEKDQRMMPLVFDIGKFVPLTWNVLTLLILHYEKHPNGKKVKDWLQMAQPPVPVLDKEE